mmetsp:Transcript_28263/g.41718  ORF Transcript_28263/g.41718 Transcript_28263/m.41718 type:complete len:87 (+) Transcript_28263:49-309(+)
MCIPSEKKIAFKRKCQKNCKEKVRKTCVRIQSQIVDKTFICRSSSRIICQRHSYVHPFSFHDRRIFGFYECSEEEIPMNQRHSVSD